MDRHIALIGFMAAGKSSVGRRLAAELHLPFIDTDDAIAERHGPIPALFERVGESGFRAREHEAVREALDAPCAVLALGGGAVTHEATRRLLAERALRVFLDVPVDVLVGRLQRGGSTRPMIGAAPDRERVEAIFAQRLPLYRDADIVVDCGHRTSAAVARRIAHLINAQRTLPA